MNTIIFELFSIKVVNKANVNNKSFNSLEPTVKNSIIKLQPK